MPLPTRSVNAENNGPSAPPTRVELPPALRAGLFDPALWQAALGKYARCTNLAVALVDTDGRLLGDCLAPQPLWQLLHAAKPAVVGVCPFALAPLKPCTCVADALTKGDLVLARDRTGLVHFTVPLLLGGNPLGALVAGQVFDQYPEQLALEQVAKVLAVPPEEVWHLARQEHPIKQATLRVYGDLLATFGQTILQTRYHTILEEERLAEMTRLRDLLAEADKCKDEFLAMLAHELRNPLAPISNALHVLTHPAANGAIVGQAGAMAERQVQHMARLLDDLLDVSRISKGKIELHTEPVEITALVGRTVEAARPLIEERRHQLTVSPASEPLWVQGDSTRLGQVVMNLLNNACKYTDPGGHIRLTVVREGTEVVLRVRDDGIGIMPDMLPKIFDLFVQAERRLDRSQGGVGIGLTLVKRLVELHGGSIEAHSPGLGQGSEFVVRLPATSDVPRGEQEGIFPEAVEGAPARLRVLVVDDNQDAADSLALLLRLAGQDVRVAYDGPSALALAREFQPALALLDIGLPGLDGYEVARRMRRQSGLEGVCLAALTGWGQQEDRRRSAEAGMDYHLVKPVEPKALKQLLIDVKSL